MICVFHNHNHPQQVDTSPCPDCAQQEKLKYDPKPKTARKVVEDRQKDSEAPVIDQAGSMSTELAKNRQNDVFGDPQEDHEDAGESGE